MSDDRQDTHYDRDEIGALDLLAGRGAISQGYVASALRGPDNRWEGQGYTTVRAIRRLVAAGIIRRPPRFARTLHSKCRADLTPSGWREYRWLVERSARSAAAPAGPTPDDGARLLLAHADYLEQTRGGAS